MSLSRKKMKQRISLLTSIVIMLQLSFAALVPLAVAAAEEETIDEAAVIVEDTFIAQPGGADEWYLTGSFQDWNNTGTPFTHLVDEFYAISIVLDAGEHEFKLTKNGTWDGFSHYDNNFSLTLEEQTKVNFYINGERNEARISVAGVEGLSQYTPVLTDDQWPRLVGSVQTVFDESEWSPSEAKQSFVDYYFDNTVYKLQRTIPSGKYEAKVVFGDSWDHENYGVNDNDSGNLALNVLDSANVTFSIDYAQAIKLLAHNYVPSDGQFDGMIDAGAISFDSRSSMYKKPFGAIAEAEEDVTLRIAAKQDDVQTAKVEMSNEEGFGHTYEMKKVTSTGGKDYFEAIIPAEDFQGIGIWSYKFILIDGATKVEYGDDGVRGGIGRAVDEGAIPFELTVYAADFKTPDWMKNAVVYQIFPDRFFDGYEGNNRAKTVDGYRGDRAEDRTGDVINAFPLQYFDGGVNNDPTPDQVWGEWSDIPEMPDRLTRENAPYYPDSRTDDIWTNEFYGGDIQGVQAKLNYLEAIGVTAIYFNPIAWAGSNHKYDATDYKHLDPMFGEPVYNIAGDPKSGLDYEATRIASDKVFIEFAQEARARGIHIISDGVFNHVGDDSIYFDRYEKYPEIGAYEFWAKVYDYVNEEGMTEAEAEQAAIDAFTAIVNPSTGTHYKYPKDFEFTTWFTIHNQKVLSRDNVYMYKYDAWWGYDSLPAMDATLPQLDDDGAIEGIHEWNVPSYRNHVIGFDLSAMSSEQQQEAMQHTASQRWNWMGASGWRLDVAPDVSFGTWEKFREAVKSQTGLPNAKGEPIDEPIILGEEWGVATHYLLGNQFDSVMNYRFRAALQSFLNGGSAQTMHTSLESIREDYPKEAWLVMMNLVGSHDTTRNITKMDFPSYEENRIGIAPAATERARKLQELTAIFQMGYPGAPTIYYGDEVGLEGTKDPDSRRTFPWERVTESNGQFSGAGQYASLFNVYQRSSELRNEYELFRTGDMQLAYAQGDVIAYARKGDGKAGLVVINKSNESAVIEADVAGFIPNGVKLVDQLHGTAEATVISGKLSLTIPALSGYMMVSEGQLIEVPVVQNVNAIGENGYVSLSWDAVAGAEGYNVYRAAIEGGEMTLLAEATADVFFTDTDVSNGVKYYYAVTALIGNSESAIVSMAAATPAFPIGSVVIVREADDMAIGVGKHTNEIEVAITVEGLTDDAQYEGKAAPNLIAKLAYYMSDTAKELAVETKLRYKEDGVDGAKIYRATFEPTETGEFYYYALASTNNGDSYTESALASFIAEADAAASTPPASPLLDEIGVESNQVRLNWTSAEDEGIKGFEVWRKQAADSQFIKIATLASTAVSYIDYSVSNDTTYIYKIAAFNQYYSRGYSEEQAVTPKLVMVDVTLRLHLPDYTPDQDSIYIAGSFNGWNASGNELKVPSGATNRSVVEYTFKMMAGKSIEYKYTRGSWETEAFTSHARVVNDREDHGNWAYSSTDTNMRLTIRNQGSNKMLIDDYVLRWVDMPMMVSMPRISYGEDIEYTAAEDENSFTIKAVVPFGVQFTVNGNPILDEEMDEYGHVLIENIPIKQGTNQFVLHMEPTEETLNQPWYVDKGRASQATRTMNITIHKQGDSITPKPTPSPTAPSGKDPSADAADELISSPTANAAGEVVLSLPEQKSRLLIPAMAEAVNKSNTFIIKQRNFETVISGQLLESLKALLDEAALADAHIVFEALPLAMKDIDELMKKASVKAKADISAAGAIYDFKLSIVDKNGNASTLSLFEPAIGLALAIEESGDSTLTGIYAIADDGALVYIDSKRGIQYMESNVTHFSKYGVLRYNKTFADVSEQYWASSVIKQLAAQGIVTGISDTEFAPLKPVTRAEFTALIVRALKLQATQAAGFTDVDDTKWYAEAVTAAYEAGIISGRTAQTFAPNETITREEMAAIMIRAYELKRGSLQSLGAGKASFADNDQISSWAKAYIDAAVELGLVQGHSGNKFAPQGQGNRAESVQIIARLIDLVK